MLLYIPHPPTSTFCFQDLYTLERNVLFLLIGAVISDKSFNEFHIGSDTGTQITFHLSLSSYGKHQ
jgi:hypothetical protein